jgi:hypothetical protein
MPMKRHLLLLSCCFVLSTVLVPVKALEIGIDASFNSSTQVDDWGGSSHIQFIGNNGIGVDLGYQYLNSITYNALGTTLSHDMSEYEASLLWQMGDKAFRLQTTAGAVFSNSWVQSAGSDVITQYSPGYQFGVDVSVPIFTRFRAFAQAGYQNWLNAEIPGHLKWRYGVRLLVGGSSVQKLEKEENEEIALRAVQEDALAENPNVTIDPNVPEYVPAHLSQSLPPIVSNAEICKCFPAGPFTLQLGEFGNMPQAIRGLEYRGLRQFFNSRAYLAAPLPVFLAQAEPTGPVGVYLGELASIEVMHFWRHELRKSGIQARFRKIISTDGSRVANPIADLDESQLMLKPKYTEEEIRRMNSLPEDWEVAEVNSAMQNEAMMAEKEAFEDALQVQRETLNQAPAIEMMNKANLQLGPIPMTSLVDIFTTDGMKSVLSKNASVTLPGQMVMVWDELNKEAWLNFSDFNSDQQVDEWMAWFNSEGLIARSVEKPYMPIGDIYSFELGQPLEEFSVEIQRESSMAQMLERMRSPEVLWFQAYQKINDEPISTTLNWSETDKRYHLIITNVSSALEQQQIWANLTAVGLLPSLAEE